MDLAQGLNPMAKAALTSGALSMLGDVCAQLLPQRDKVSRNLSNSFSFRILYFHHRLYASRHKRNGKQLR
jgi:hypothetical protein